MSLRSNTISMRHKIAAWRALSVFRQPYLSREGAPSETESSASDSEMYDTDLELDDVKKTETTKTKKNADREINVNTYKKICDEIHQAPQRKVIKSLSQDTLDLSNRNLGGAATTGLAAALVSNTHVTKLDLSGNALGFEGGQDIASVIEENHYITHLNLSRNKFGKTGVSKRLSEMMKANTSVIELNLSENCFDENDAKHLASGIQFNEWITDLDLSHNNFCELGAQYIGKALGDNAGIVSINLSWNNIRKKGAVTIFKSLRYNCLITKLDLSWNGLGYEGALSFGEMLKKNKTLTFVDASSNRINWEGAMFIAGGLQENDTLETLRLGHNTLTTTGCQDIVEALYGKKGNAGLKMLDIEGVPVIKDFEITAHSIQRKREFNYRHGGVVPSHDILGSREERPIHPMQRIIDYMNEKELRPMELLRSFDKDVKFKISEEDFIERIQGTGIKLHPHEIEQLMEFLKSKGKKKNGTDLNYDQLVEGVTSHVEKDRNFEIAKREYGKQKQEYHHRLLNPALPPLEKVEETPRRSVVSLNANFSTRSRLSAGNLLSSRSLNPVANIANYRLDSRPLQSTGRIMFSMTAPVIGVKPKKVKPGGKQKKKKRKNKAATTEEAQMKLPQIEQLDIRPSTQMETFIESPPPSEFHQLDVQQGPAISI